MDLQVDLKQETQQKGRLAIVKLKPLSLFISLFQQKGAGSFHIHRKTMKELGILALLGIRERPNLAQNLVTH